MTITVQTSWSMSLTFQKEMAEKWMTEKLGLLSSSFFCHSFFAIALE
jgi:hypothetical protein